MALEKIRTILLKKGMIEEYNKITLLDYACQTRFSKNYSDNKRENNLHYYIEGQLDLLAVLSYIHMTFFDECKEKGEAGMIELKDLLYKCFRDLGKNIDKYHDLFN